MLDWAIGEELHGCVVGIDALAIKLEEAAAFGNFVAD